MSDPIPTIDEFVHQILLRPTMYVSCPESLDDALSLFETLRNLLQAPEQPTRHEFSDYLIKKGYDARNLSQTADLMGLRTPEEKYHFISNSWDEFFNSIGRAHE